MAWRPYYGRRCSKIVPPNATVEREVQSVLEDYPILLARALGAAQPSFRRLGIDEQHADPYFHGVKEFCQQVLDGRMPYIATVRDDMKLLFNHPGMTLREWATFHKSELIGAAVRQRSR